MNKFAVFFPAMSICSSRDGLVVFNVIKNQRQLHKFYILHFHCLARLLRVDVFWCVMARWTTPIHLFWVCFLVPLRPPIHPASAILLGNVGFAHLDFFGADAVAAAMFRCCVVLGGAVR
jgi:hypothetical protein